MSFHPSVVWPYLVLGTANDSFECELRSLLVNPSPEWIRTLCPAGSWPDVSWTLDLGYLPGTYSADPETGEEAGDLDDYLADHYGEQAAFFAWPYGQQQRGWTGITSIAPGPAGGNTAEWPEHSVSLPIYGQPDSVAVGTSVPVAVQEAQQLALRRRVTARRTSSLIRW